MKILAFLPALLLSMALALPGALAQERERGKGVRQGGAAAGQDRQRPPDKARDHRGPRPERMRPEERDKLRRDIEDANRHMERRR